MLLPAGLQVTPQEQRSGPAWQRRGQQATAAAAAADAVPAMLDDAGVSQQYGQRVADGVRNWAANTDKLDLELVTGVISHICRYCVWCDMGLCKGLVADLRGVIRCLGCMWPSRLRLCVMLSLAECSNGHSFAGHSVMSLPCGSRLPVGGAHGGTLNANGRPAAAINQSMSAHAVILWTQTTSAIK